MKARRNLILLIALLAAGGVAFFFEGSFSLHGGPSKGTLLVFPGFEPWKVNKIDIGNGDLVFENLDGNWFLVTESRHHPADRKQVTALLQAIRELKRDNIVSENRSKHPLFGVKAGEGTEIVFFDLDGKRLAGFLVGKKGPDGLSAYIRRTDGDEVILQPGNLRDHLDKPAKLWRERKIFSLKSHDIVEMTFQIEQETILLNRDTRGGWFIVKPVARKADGGRVEQVISILNELEAADFADSLNPGDAGLITPPLRLAVRLKDRSMKMLLIGYPANEWGHYAMTGEDQSVLVLQNGVVRALFPEIKDLEASVMDESENPSAQ